MSTSFSPVLCEAITCQIELGVLFIEVLKYFFYSISLLAKHFEFLDLVART